MKQLNITLTAKQWETLEMLLSSAAIDDRWYDVWADIRDLCAVLGIQL